MKVDHRGGWNQDCYFTANYYYYSSQSLIPATRPPKKHRLPLGDSAKAGKIVSLFILSEGLDLLLLVSALKTPRTGNTVCELLKVLSWSIRASRN